MGKKKLGVVYITHRRFNEDELKLLKYSLCRLSAYDKFIVYPEAVSIENQFEGFQQVKEKLTYFTHINGYNEMLMRPEFYKRFSGYENILIMQSDCVILKNDIDRFCGIYPYLGASFLKPRYINYLWVSKIPRLGHLLSRFRIGRKILGFNGGLSIRNIDFCSKYAPMLKAPGDRLVYREDIMFSYLTWKNVKEIDIEIADSFCLEEKLIFCNQLSDVKAYGLHDPKKYNSKIYDEILQQVADS